MEEEIINLLDDPNFKLWVLFPNESCNRFWSQIIKDQPNRRESIQKARLILKAMNNEFKVDFPETETVNKMLRKIFSSK